MNKINLPTLWNTATDKWHWDIKL